MIENIKDLADAMTFACNLETDDDERATRMVARRLYKDTSCGISFWMPDSRLSVSVSGYCEGSDVEHPAHTLDFPFTAEVFDEAVRQADKDGCETWDATHGCEHCHTAEMKTEQTKKGWRIAWPDAPDLTWWADGDPSEIQYRAEEWEIRMDFSEEMYAMEVGVPINPDCTHCEGGGRVI